MRRGRFRRHGLQPQQEGVQGRGRMEIPASDLRIPVRLHRRHLPQAQLGRLLWERGSDGGHRRERGRIPRGHRLRRGLHGVQGVLAGLFILAEVARAARRAHVHRRQGRRHGGLDRRGVPECQIPALHRALLPQRAGQDPQIQALPGRGHAQDNPRHGVARDLGGKGRVGGRRARVDEAEGGRQGRARGLRRDADVLRDAPRALAAHPHEQRHRAAQQGDQAQDPRGRHVPRQEIRTDAGAHLPEVRRGQRMELPPILGRVSAQRVAVPGLAEFVQNY